MSPKLMSSLAPFVLGVNNDVYFGAKIQGEHMAEIRFTLRLPEDLHNMIKQKADETGRSINEQVVFMLSDHLQLKSELERRVIAIEEQLAQIVQQTKSTAT